MTRYLVCGALLAFALIVGLTSDAHAFNRRRSDRTNQLVSQNMPWHDEYYHTSHGYPVPLVVPPTARSSTEWSWGVTQSTVMPIYHQFRPGYPGDGVYSEGNFRPTPNWPSHTRQFGVHYVRGPW